jgi:hypothetical protein
MLIVLGKSKKIQIGQMLIFSYKNKKIVSSLLAEFKEIVLYYSEIKILEIRVGE